jgi:hypothetical protein
MAWNGTGTFNRIYSWVADKAAAIDITGSRMDTDTNDIVSNGLGNCLTRDGQGQPTANLPMNGFKHTGAAAGSSSGDYATFGQLTNGTVPFDGTTITGTSFVSSGSYTGTSFVSSGSYTGTSFVSSGSYIFSDGTELNSAISLGTRNRFINGGMAIDQRHAGASQTITAGAALAYTIDRWYAFCTGANVTGQRVGGTASDQFYYVFTGASSNATTGFGQRIEAANSFDLAGTTATLSVSLASSSLTTVTWTAYYANSTDAFGSLASPTKTQFATGSFTITSTLTRYTASVSVPSAATTGIEVVFTTGALGATQTLTYSASQIEPGSVATPLDRPLIGDVYDKCLRYYRVVTTYIQNIGASGAASLCSFPAGIPEMRVTPTATQINPGTSTNSSSFSCTVIAANLISWNAIPGTGYWYWINPVYGLSAEL